MLKFLLKAGALVAAAGLALNFMKEQEEKNNVSQTADQPDVPTPSTKLEQETVLPAQKDDEADSTSATVTEAKEENHEQI